MMPVEKISVSMPAELLSEIDGITAKWFTNRSQAIVRIFQEWKQYQISAQSFSSIRLSNSADENQASIAQKIYDEPT